MHFGKFEILGEVLLKPYANELFELAEDVIVIAHSKKFGIIRFTLKAGFITDLGSVPKILQYWFPYTGNQYLAVSYALHDILHSTQSHLHSFSKDFVDELLYEMVLVLPTGVSDFKASCIYKAVTWFGTNAWDTFDGYDLEAIDKGLLKVDWSNR